MITTARLLLRGAEPRDLAAFHAIYGSPEAMRYWASPPDATIGDSQKRLDQFIAQDDPATVLVLDLNGEAVGTAGLWRGSEIGYILHPDHWGKSLMREALEALIPYLFEQANVAQLNADIDPRNRASVALLTRLGFHVSGYAHRNFERDGEYLDSVYMRLDPAGQRPDSR